MDSIGNVIWRVFLTLIFLISSLFFIVSLVLFSNGEWLTGIALLGLAPTSFVMLHAGARWIFTGQHPKPQDYLGNRIVVSSIQIALLLSRRLWAVVRALFSYFYNLKTSLPKTMRGEYGLARTYWAIGVLGSLILTLAIILPSRFILYPFLAESGFHTAANLILDAVVVLGLTFSVFITISVVNASSIKGKRTGWGWAAIFAVGFGLMSTLWSAMGHFGLRDTSWDEWEEAIRFENLTLPRKVDNITSLEKISMSDTDKSITYRFSVDDPSIRDTDMRSVILQGCADLKDLFSIFSLIRFEYVDRSEFVLVEVLSSDDCNF